MTDSTLTQTRLQRWTWTSTGMIKDSLGSMIDYDEAMQMIEEMTKGPEAWLQSWIPDKQTNEAVRIRGIPVEPGWVEEFRLWAEDPDHKVTQNNVKTKYVRWCKYERINSAVIKSKMPSRPQSHKVYQKPPEEPITVTAAQRDAARAMISKLVGSKKTQRGGPSLDDRKRNMRRKVAEASQ